jgi:hypothetical protein
MNNDDKMVFGNDSLHGLEDPKHKTKTQEETINQGGYQGQNRKEIEQGQPVTETQQPTDSEADDNRNWKVIGRKSSTPIRKAATRGDKDGEKAADTAREGNNSTHKFGGPPGSST